MKQLLRVAAISVATIALLASCSKSYCKKSSCHGYKKEVAKEENVKGMECPQLPEQRLRMRSMLLS